MNFYCIQDISANILYYYCNVVYVSIFVCSDINNVQDNKKQKKEKSKDQRCAAVIVKVTMVWLHTSLLNAQITTK